MLKAIEIESIVDFGAGYGRVGIVMQSVFPKAKFLGYEIVSERVDEGNRVLAQLGLEKNVRLLTQDILGPDFKFPKADLYFVYDFSEPRDIKIMLDNFSEKLSEDKFFIVAKGAGIRSMIQNKYPEFYACFGVHHTKEWSLYSSFMDIDDLTKK